MACPCRGSSSPAPTETTRTTATSSGPGAGEDRGQADGCPHAGADLAPLGLHNTASWATPRSPSRRCMRSLRNGAGRSASPTAAVRRGDDLLEPVLDNLRRRGPDHRHLRHDGDGGSDRRGDVAVAGIHAAQIAPDLIGFGAWSMAVCPATPSTRHTTTGSGQDWGSWLAPGSHPRRLRRGHGLPARQEDRDLGRRDLPRGELHGRRRGQLHLRHGRSCALRGDRRHLALDETPPPTRR